MQRKSSMLQAQLEGAASAVENDAGVRIIEVQEAGSAPTGGRFAWPHACALGCSSAVISITVCWWVRRRAERRRGGQHLWAA